MTFCWETFILWDLCIAHEIDLEAYYLSGDLNSLADCLS